MAYKRNRNWIQDYFFLIVPKPQKDELLSSWLYRTSLVHKRSLSVFLSLFVRQQGGEINRHDIDFKYDDKLFDTLSLKSGLSKKEIIDMSLRGEEGYLFTCNDCLYPPYQIRKLIDKRTHNGLMYCSKCLKEDTIPYFRKHWRYTFCNACPKHKIFLKDRCPSCNEKISYTKTKTFKDIFFCYNCGINLKDSISIPLQSNYLYGLKAINWFKKGLENGYFLIDNQKVNSLFIFESFTTLQYLIDRKEKLTLNSFPLIEEYKSLFNNQDSLNNSFSIKKDFLLTSMIYHLFQNFPNNFKEFITCNNRTHRDFTHGFKNASFWYENMIGEIIPIQNKIGREINESEVLGAIKYLKGKKETINQLNVANIVGCHFTIHKGFVKIYKSINK